MFESILKYAASAAPLVSAGAQFYAANEARRSANRQSKLIQAQASRDAATRQRKNRQLLAAQRARYGAAGVTLDGTPGLVLDETDQLAQQDISDILYFGNANARATRKQGQGAFYGGLAGGVGSLAGYGDESKRNDLLGGFKNFSKLFGW